MRKLLRVTAGVRSADQTQFHALRGQIGSGLPGFVETHPG